jgi:hypothetical protein
MPTWRNSASMPKVRASSGTMGTTSLPICSCLSSFDSIFTNTIVVDALRPSVPFSNSSKVSPSSALIFSARGWRLGTGPFNAARRSRRYFISALSSAGR